MLLERKLMSYTLLVTVAFCLETQTDASKVFAESNQGVEPEQTAATHLPGSQSKLEFSGWKVFKGHGDAVRFTYPDNWIEDKTPKTGKHPEEFLVELRSPDGSTSANLTMFPAKLTLLKYKEDYGKGINDDTFTTTVISDRIVQVDGADIYQKMSRTRVTDGRDAAQFAFVMIRDEMVYQLVLTCPFSKFDEKGPLLVHIGQSMRLRYIDP